jgi:hypothetical protein
VGLLQHVLEVLVQVLGTAVPLLRVLAAHALQTILHTEGESSDRGHTGVVSPQPRG